MIAQHDITLQTWTHHSLAIEVQIFRNQHGPVPGLGGGLGGGGRRAPGLSMIPRQKSLDSSLAAAQMNQIGLLHRSHGPVRGSATNLYNQ